MVKPLNIMEQMQNDYFKPDRLITVYFAQTNFDRVGNIKEDGSFRPYYKTLDSTQDDVEKFHHVIQKYKISEYDKEIFLGNAIEVTTRGKTSG